MKKEWMEEMKANMDGNDKEVEEMRLSYEEKLKAAQAAAAAAAAASGAPAAKQVRKEMEEHPHIYNLNFDPQLSGKIVHILKKPETEIGNRKGNESDVCMVGPG
jgi:kinesin family protein 1